ncbi:hypothetical protein KCU85_g272, partial [Aureobasidium melanogenum]
MNWGICAIAPLSLSILAIIEEGIKATSTFSDTCPKSFIHAFCFSATTARPVRQELTLKRRRLPSMVTTPAYKSNFASPASKVNTKGSAGAKERDWEFATLRQPLPSRTASLG